MHPIEPNSRLLCEPCHDIDSPTEQLDTIAERQVRDSLLPNFEPGQRGLPKVKDASGKLPTACSEADCVGFDGYVTFDLSVCLAKTR